MCLFLFEQNTFDSNNQLLKNYKKKLFKLNNYYLNEMNGILFVIFDRNKVYLI